MRNATGLSFGARLEASTAVAVVDGGKGGKGGKGETRATREKKTDRMEARIAELESKLKAAQGRSAIALTPACPDCPHKERELQRAVNLRNFWRKKEEELRMNLERLATKHMEELTEMQSKHERAMEIERSKLEKLRTSLSYRLDKASECLKSATQESSLKDTELKSIHREHQRESSKAAALAKKVEELTCLLAVKDKEVEVLQTKLAEIDRELESDAEQEDQNSENTNTQVSSSQYQLVVPPPLVIVPDHHASLLLA